ncbi:MAG TPA: AAA family ATPase [Streptosporangiaceae bacterium]|nr:AAA family ATPase [Streptosporangiaceae bacterium]
MVGAHTALIGRDRELSRLRGLVDPAPAQSRILVILGDPGMGKTALLNETTWQARSAGMALLAVAGRESEQDLAFAGLHQLLRPVLDRAAGLPERQVKALAGAFGLAPDPAPADALLTGMAVLTMLSDLSEDRPLLVTADDAQWLDRASLDALAFAARRLEPEPLVLLLGARGTTAPPGFERDIPELRLRPLSPPDAGRLLAAQPHPPRGQARQQVLAQAAGNPMALIELSEAIAADPAAGRRWAAEPLPLTDRLSAVITHRLRALPQQTRAALLLAAVADRPDLTPAGVSGLTAGALAAAEVAGLVRVDGSGAQFTHPLIRSAVYHGAPFADRAAAHLRVAEALRDQPDRYAWHLAAAAMEPDEHVASLLEQTAADTQRRGGAAAAARALSRSAELSSDRDQRARRLLAAAALALTAGQADWVQELAEQALSVTADPDLRTAALLRIGWALTWSNQRAAALSTLLSVAGQTAPKTPALAWEALANAATVAHQSGAPAEREMVRRVLANLLGPASGPPAGDAENPGGPGGQDTLAARWLWIQAITDPLEGRDQLLPHLRRLASTQLVEPALSGVGATAWILDETELATGLLGEAVRRARAPGIIGASGASLTGLGWACVDAGRWDSALAVAAEASDLADAYQLDMVAASAALITATVLAMRGDGAGARDLAARALAVIDPAQSGLVAARARRVFGIAALDDGAHLTGFAQFRQMFGPDGEPLHAVVSCLGLADMAAAAVRADRQLEALAILERVTGRPGATPSPRLEQILARARGLLDEAGEQFEKALSDPAGARWPFERAQLQLDYGEWLRRQRRINEAKPVLLAALESFRLLQAASSARRCETELRACGVGVSAEPGTPDALAQLTPQQREIVILAGRGLTNREIGDRLFLSPRTVASHLYRSYPRLGIAGRHQLGDLIARAGAEPRAGSGH